MIATLLRAIETRLKQQIPEIAENIHRFRTYSFNAPVSLNILFGAVSHDEKAGITNSRIEIIVQLRVAVTGEIELDQKLAEYYAKVFTALTENETLGLPFVIDATPIESSAPEASEDSESPSVLINMSFSYLFRHPRTDLNYQE